ncbi:uncharacterized protein PAC_08499 [Phialocephala subalpina]|uniref:Uncharacterized protein n=1 Tax=Phialocephala subalpina TaxID=576137 RepID=A0A1L7X0R2_9HELO|nr:uncharacterized protein PAC_08499 [Phialocephala subalpina]
MSMTIRIVLFEQLPPSILQSINVETAFRSCLEQAQRSYRERGGDRQPLKPLSRLSVPTQGAQENSESGVAVPRKQLECSEPSGLDFAVSVVRPPPLRQDSRVLDPSLEDSIRRSSVVVGVKRSSDSGYASGKLCNCTGTCNCQASSMISHKPPTTESTSFSQLVANNRYPTFAEPTPHVPPGPFDAGTIFNGHTGPHSSEPHDQFQADFSVQNFPGGIDYSSLLQSPSSQGNIWLHGSTQGGALTGDGHQFPQQSFTQPSLNSLQSPQSAGPLFNQPLTSLVPPSTQTDGPAQDSSWLDDIEWNYDPVPELQNGLGNDKQWDADNYEDFSARPS